MGKAMKDGKEVGRIRCALSELGCRRIELVHENGRRSAIENDRAIGMALIALTKELDRQTAEEEKAVKTPQGPFVILAPTGEFFREVSACLPPVFHSFNAEYARAKKFGSYEEAAKARAELCKVLKDGGGKPLPKRYFRIAEVTFRTVG